MEYNNGMPRILVSGSPLGCAMQVPMGSEPNEHGTWLYGRDGWCDGQNVQPWKIDVTKDLNTKQMASELHRTDATAAAESPSNSIRYHGYFNGTDPNPKKTPGVMIFASYLVFFDAL